MENEKIEKIETYSGKWFHHPDWYKIKGEVLKRDKNKCGICGTENCFLFVHHKVYIDDGRLPHEYPIDLLISVCKKCHESEHRINAKKSEEEAREFLRKKEQEEAENLVYELFAVPNAHQVPYFKTEIDPPEELRRKVIRGNPDIENPDFNKQLNGWSEGSKNITSACLKRRDASQEQSYRIVLDMVAKSEKECDMHVPKCEICSFLIRFAEANGAYEAFIESKKSLLRKK